MSSPITNIAALALLSGLAGCAGTPEGLFEPACLAHAGDRVEINDGRFEWNRFTDQVSVDEDGKRVDPFPGYPKSGEFELDGARLSMTADDGTAIDDRFLYEYRGRTWLLTDKQHAAVLEGDTMPACALVLGERQR